MIPVFESQARLPLSKSSGGGVLACFLYSQKTTVVLSRVPTYAPADA